MIDENKSAAVHSDASSWIIGLESMVYHNEHLPDAGAKCWWRADMFWLCVFSVLVVLFFAGFFSARLKKDGAAIWWEIFKNRIDYLENLLYQLEICDEMVSPEKSLCAMIENVAIFRLYFDVI